MNEVWEWVTGYEGLYQVSSLGNIKNAKREKPIRTHITKDGAVSVTLFRDNYPTQHFLAYFVAEAFVENRNHHRFVRHKDGDKTNNRADNLIWGRKSGGGFAKKMENVRVILHELDSLTYKELDAVKELYETMKEKLEENDTYERMKTNDNEKRSIH